MNKLLIIDKFIYDLHTQWYIKETLSLRKLHLLLFISVYKDKEMLNIFNNFEAWFFWPTEIDVNNYIKNKKWLVWREININLFITNTKKERKYNKDVNIDLLVNKMISNLKLIDKDIFNKKCHDLLLAIRNLNTYKLSLNVYKKMDTDFILKETWKIFFNR